jgi:hypothetical protein
MRYKFYRVKGFYKNLLGDWSAAYQLVGEVMAHLGYDG